jgi:hypothetical protein
MVNAIDSEIWFAFERMKNTVRDTIDLDVDEIKERVSRAFRQFLLDREQERMPFLQRVMTSHLENMEDERGFPPRHPVHWFRSQLEFSATGILTFDSSKEAEEFVRAALNYIETEIKEQLTIKQREVIDLVDRGVTELQQLAIAQVEPIAKDRKIIATEYVNGFIRSQGLEIKVIDRFYFVDGDTRFDRQRSILHMEVCERGRFKLGIGNKEQLKYAVACDRLVDIANSSISRSISLLKQQTQTYFTDELSHQLTELIGAIG